MYKSQFVIFIYLLIMYVVIYRFIDLPGSLMIYILIHFIFIFDSPKKGIDVHGLYRNNSGSKGESHREGGSVERHG